MRAYELWRKTWHVSAYPDGFISDSFLNADKILSLSSDSEPVLLCICNFYDVSKIYDRESSYMSGLQSYGFLTDNDQIMSVEYISANRRWRRKGISLGKLIVGLSQKLFIDSSATVSVGTAVKSSGVPKMVEEFGFRSLGTIERYGLDCELVINRRETNKRSEDLQLDSLINILWSQENEVTQEVA